MDSILLFLKYDIMRLIFFFVVGLCYCTVDAQSIQWEKSYGGVFSETTSKIITSPDGGYLVCATAESNNGDVSGNHGGTDLWLLKVDNTGEKEWQKCLGGINLDGISWIENDPTGGYFLAGNTFSNGLIDANQVYGNHGGQDIWVVKVDENGVLEWRKCYGGCDREEVREIKLTRDGNLIVVGGTLSDNTGDVYGAHGNWDAWILKITLKGDLLWQKTMGGIGIDYLYGVEEVDEGNLIFHGLTSSEDGDLTGNSNKGAEDVWVFQLSTNGDNMWSSTFGGSKYDGARGMCTSSADGSIMVLGTSASDDGDVTGAHGGNDVWIIQLDATGNLLWQKAFGGSDDESGFDIFQRAENDFIVTGETSSFDGDVEGNHGGTDALIIKVDKNGNLKEQICLGGSNNDYARSSVSWNNEEIVVGGTASSFDGDVSENIGQFDVWLVSLSVPLGLKPPPPNTVQFELKVWPNPVHGKIEIETNIAGDKKISFYDSSGKLAQVVDMDGYKKSVDVSALSSGAYLVKAITQEGLDFATKFVKE